MACIDSYWRNTTRSVALVAAHIQSETNTYMPWLFRSIMESMPPFEARDHRGPVVPLYYTRNEYTHSPCEPSVLWTCKRCNGLVR